MARTGAFLRRVNRAIARFNDSLGPVAAATEVETQQRGVDALDVNAVLGALERHDRAAHEPDGERAPSSTKPRYRAPY